MKLLQRKFMRSKSFKEALVQFFFILFYKRKTKALSYKIKDKAYMF